MRRRPSVCFRVSAIDTPSLSLFPSYPSLAVSNATASKTRAPLRLLPSSTRRRSQTSSEPPPPKCLLSCQRPLIDTPTLSPFPILPLARSLWGNNIRAEGASALAAILKETKITTLKCAAAPAKRLLLCQRPLTLPPSPWQLGRQPALRPRLRRRRHLHCGGHHQTVRGAQGEHRDLAEVRRPAPKRFRVSAR